MSRRLGITLAIIGLIIAIAGFLVISSILRRVSAPPPQPTLPAPITEAVVVTTHDVALRAVLNPEDLTIVDVPVELVPDNALGSVEDALGRITKIPLMGGEMVMDHHLADPTNRIGDLAFVIEDDQVLMAVPSTDLMSDISILQAGDIIDVLVSIEQPVLVGQAGAFEANPDEQEEEDMLFTFDALQRLEISAVIVEIVQSGSSNQSSASGFAQQTEGEEGEGEAQPTPTPTPTPAPSQVNTQAILIAVDPQDALVLKHIIDAGGILDFVLRAPTSNQDFELQPVNSEYIEDRYELIITR